MTGRAIGRVKEMSGKTYLINVLTQMSLLLADNGKHSLLKKYAFDATGTQKKAPHISEKRSCGASYGAMEPRRQTEIGGCPYRGIERTRTHKDICLLKSEFRSEAIVIEGKRNPRFECQQQIFQHISID
jgi:hypothetical protein